jgi:8-oxo-dGTP pyrophosphatase MutT (NUDIX family)
MTDYLKWIRSKVGHRKIILVYATAVIRNERGEILFQRRSDFDWWGLPGGVLELGETFEECAARETLEESGYIVEPIRQIGVYTSPEYDVRYPNGDEAQQYTVTIECRVVGGSPHPDGSETLENRFFAPDQVPNLPSWYAAMARDCLNPKNGTLHFDPTQFDSKAGEGWRDLRDLTGEGRIITPGATAVIQNDCGEVLLGLHHTGLWGMLPAGLMEIGESISGTVVREGREELGVEIAPRELIGVFTGGDDAFHTYEDGNQVQLVSSLFRADIVSGTPKPDGKEVLELRWFDPNHLPQNMMSRRKRLLEIALKVYLPPKGKHKP